MAMAELKIPPAEDTLTAYSLAVVDQALAAHIPFPAREGGDR